jgi:hypothetical protein
MPINLLLANANFESPNFFEDGERGKRRLSIPIERGGLALAGIEKRSP